MTESGLRVVEEILQLCGIREALRPPNDHPDLANCLQRHCSHEVPSECLLCGAAAILQLLYLGHDDVSSLRGFLSRTVYQAVPRK